MAVSNMKTVAFLKKRTSKSGKEYFSYARVEEGKTANDKAQFTWNNSLVGFMTKKGDLMIKERSNAVA